MAFIDFLNRIIPGGGETARGGQHVYAPGTVDKLQFTRSLEILLSLSYNLGPWGIRKGLTKDFDL